MVRKQVHKEPEQLAHLERKVHDQLAWAEAKAFITQRRRATVPQAGRKWTREELYEERLQFPG